MKSPFLGTQEIKKEEYSPRPLKEKPYSPNKKPIIKLENVEVVYCAGKNNESRALDGISLEIYPEEYIIFFGPSGSGKSTLLNVIAGLEIPSRGKVIVDHEDLSRFSSEEIAKFHRKKTGIIFQIYNLITTLSVLDNVVIPQVFERVKPSKRKEAGRALLKKLGIDLFENKMPQELSGGQQQRVGIARALMNDPPILLADEATGNLDSEAARNVLGIFENLNTEGKKTIIFVTHNPEHLSYADRVFYMKDGKILKVVVNEVKSKIRGESEDGGIKKERTELDILLEAYPDLSAMQLKLMMVPFKAKMLATYLLSCLQPVEVKIMEQAITDRLMDNIGKQELLEIFDAPPEKGGLGLNKNTALKFSSSVEEVVEKAKIIQGESENIKEGQEENIRKAIDEVRTTILEEYEGNLTLDQVEALNKGIEYRILSKISQKEFMEYLDSPFEKGGVGLNSRGARNLAKKMEIIMLLKFGG